MSLPEAPEAGLSDGHQGIFKHSQWAFAYSLQQEETPADVDSDGINAWLCLVVGIMQLLDKTADYGYPTFRVLALRFSETPRLK